MRPAKKKLEFGKISETPKLMENATRYPKNDSHTATARPVASPYFIGVEAALARASAKAIAKARAAGLKPVVGDTPRKKQRKTRHRKARLVSDLILAIGYRVRFPQGVQFRQ